MLLYMELCQLLWWEGYPLWCAQAQDEALDLYPEFVLAGTLMTEP